MSEHKYSVSEIDELRRVVEFKWLFGCYSPANASRVGMSRSYRGEEKELAVEAMVRTHMLAGHTAQELVASEQVAHLE
jgi:hypothetical protein